MLLLVSLVVDAKRENYSFHKMLKRPDFRSRLLWIALSWKIGQVIKRPIVLLTVRSITNSFPAHRFCFAGCVLILDAVKGKRGPVVLKIVCSLSSKVSNRKSGERLKKTSSLLWTTAHLGFRGLSPTCPNLIRTLNRNLLETTSTIIVQTRICSGIA